MVSPAKAETPFTFQRLDHIVIRCRDTQKMLDFYVGVLGAEPEWVGRMDGALSHLRIGSSLIDLQGYEAPGGLKLHAGGKGTEAKPEIDATKGTLDHFAINVAQYDPKAVTAYLTENGYAPYSQGGGLRRRRQRLLHVPHGPRGHRRRTQVRQLGLIHIQNSADSLRRFNLGGGLYSTPSTRG